MANNNSLFNKFSRYVAGGRTETADGRIEWWERGSLAGSDTDKVYVVENFYEGRLDLISTVFYSEPRWWWLLAQYNNILDPFSEIVTGRVLLIPNKDRLSLLISTTQGGYPSLREPVSTISPIIT